MTFFRTIFDLSMSYRQGGGDNGLIWTDCNRYLPFFTDAAYCHCNTNLHRTWTSNLGRHIPDFIPALWKVRKCIKYGKVKENSVKYPNVENCISVLLWFIIRLSVLKKFYIRNSYLQITGLHIPVYEFFTVLFPIFLLRFVLWRKFFFFDTVSLVTWCGRGNVGYYSETDRVVEHREMGLRQIETAFSLVFGQFFKWFFQRRT